MTHDSRLANYHNGIIAEYIAAAYLLLCGYWPLYRRLRTPLGEIDFVLRTRRYLIFLEVKRRQDGIGSDNPISATQQQRLHRAAQWFIQSHPRYAHLTPRLDAIVIAPKRWPVHVRNAL
jgi:putative endonuclease